MSIINIIIILYTIHHSREWNVQLKIVVIRGINYKYSNNFYVFTKNELDDNLLNLNKILLQCLIAKIINIFIIFDKYYNLLAQTDLAQLYIL